METFNLNIIPGATSPVCHASQYDIGRTIRINLFDGVSVFTLSGAETVSLSVRKPDGNVVTAAVTNTSDSYVEFVTTEQMTACHGSNLCELKLEEGGDVIGTMNFILEVEQDPLEGGVQSASDIDNLQTQIAGMVATEVASQYDSANVIFDAAPTAGHGVGYAVTSEGVKNEVDQLQTAISAKQDITDASLDTDATTIVGAINELHDSIGADVFDPNTSYTAGMYCIYNNTLYRCKGNTSGAWDSSKWEAKTITSLIESKADSADVYTKSDFSIKTASVALTSVSASDIATVDVTVNDSKMNIVAGFGIADSVSVVAVQVWFTSSTNIRLRVRNVSNASATFSAYIKYI